MQNGVSGWYARLDRVLADRLLQMQIWVEAWEKSLRTFKPIASLLPDDWPTLPANLLTDPGHVLDHLLARYDAESDGRSARGAHATPPRFADATISSEILESLTEIDKTPEPQNHQIANLPPAFRAKVQQMQIKNVVDDKVDNEEEQRKVDKNQRTVSGILLPVADSACGAGLFHARLIRRHGEIHSESDAELKLEDTRRLLNNFQLMDVSRIAVEMTRTRLLLEACRFGLVSLDEQRDGKLGRVEAEEILSKTVKQGDTLLGGWPFEDKPKLMFADPPWLRIKDRFRGKENGSELRKDLGSQLREISDDGKLRFSTMRGNVNLYRLFIERGLQILDNGGRLRIITPDSLLREQSSKPLRRLLVKEHGWHQVWSIEESNLLYPGMTQGVCVLGVISGENGCELKLRSPVTKSDLTREKGGLSKKVPAFILEENRWTHWTKGSWAIPRLPRDPIERKHTLKVLDELADKPRLGDSNNWLATENHTVRVRVGEIDQTNHSKSLSAWVKGKKARPFIRGVHFSESENGNIFVRHPAFVKNIPSRANERQLSMWLGGNDSQYGMRLACQAIVNAHQERRLRWAVIPQGCVLGNSVNHIELHNDIEEKLIVNHGNLESGLQWLCDHLNADDLDEWARTWSANNNVNNYELEMLPIDLMAINAEITH